MKDYMTIYARVKSIKVTLENIKTGKIKIKEYDFPNSLWETELEIVNPDETQIVKDRITQHWLAPIKICLDIDSCGRRPERVDF